MKKIIKWVMWGFAAGILFTLIWIRVGAAGAEEETDVSKFWTSEDHSIKFKSLFETPIMFYTPNGTVELKAGEIQKMDRDELIGLAAMVSLCARSFVLVTEEEIEHLGKILLPRYFGGKVNRKAGSMVINKEASE